MISKIQLICKNRKLIRASSRSLCTRAFCTAQSISKQQSTNQKVINRKSIGNTSTMSIHGECGYMQSGSMETENQGPRVLVTGALGQIGSELIPFLCSHYGKNNVVSSDIKQNKNSPSSSMASNVPFVYADVQNYDMLARVVLENDIDIIVHLASLLSAIGEKNPHLAMTINTRGIENVLEVARNNNLRVFAPSSIAVFGPQTPKINTPQLTVMRPTTVYGVTKIYTELMGEYYHKKYGVDFRSLRFPGIISSQAMPGGGTTDYAVEIYHSALKSGNYTCFLNKDCEMPMMYMPDTLKSIVQLINAPNENLKHRTYNITGMSFTPEMIAEQIRSEIPNFKIEYKPDFRQRIADTWPRSIDDSDARSD